MTSVVGRFEWRGERLSLRPVSLRDVRGIVAFYRQRVDGLGEDASPVDWFSTGGPWMHEHFCARHLRVYEDLGWECWVVERGDGTIAGSVEICYAVEPPPFGRYAHLELLELSDDLLAGERLEVAERPVRLGRSVGRGRPRLRRRVRLRPGRGRV